VERVVAGERADLLAGLHALLAHGAGVVEHPRQGGDAAERGEADPSPRAPHDNGDDAHGHAGDGKGDAEHGVAGDGHPRPIVVGVGHRSLAPLNPSPSPLDGAALSCSCVLWFFLARSLSHVVLWIVVESERLAKLAREAAQVFVGRRRMLNSELLISRLVSLLQGGTRG